jgi:hypothetical protein
MAATRRKKAKVKASAVQTKSAPPPSSKVVQDLVRSASKAAKAILGGTPEAALVEAAERFGAIRGHVKDRGDFEMALLNLDLCRGFSYASVHLKTPGRRPSR